MMRFLPDYFLFLMMVVEMFAGVVFIVMLNMVFIMVIIMIVMLFLFGFFGFFVAC
jgi:hypothetical protein